MIKIGQGPKNRKRLEFGMCQAGYINFEYNISCAKWVAEPYYREEYF